MADGAEPKPRRLSLLYQLYLTSQASRRFMKAALAGTGMTGEEYALHSYLFANGPRTMSQAARDLGLPVTTVATLLAPLVADGQIERRPHPRDRRANLLAQTDAGRARLERAIPVFSAAYRQVLAELESAGVEQEPIFTALAQLREATVRAMERIAAVDEEAGLGA
jgi:MarR family transcriptional regulator, transcriptional regulator for hemolysin